MTHRTTPFTSSTRLALAAGCALLVFAASGCTQPATTASSSSSALPASESDARSAAAFVRPADLAATLAGTGEKPLLLHVGFQVLYRGGAIPGSHYAGPGSTSEGLASLAAAVKDVPHEKSIVIYCGCCPWDHCPNMGPAFKELREMGYTNVRALYTPKNLETDWVDHGYPIEKPSL
jgi:hypothetical protein